VLGRKPSAPRSARINRHHIVVRCQLCSHHTRTYTDITRRLCADARCYPHAHPDVDAGTNTYRYSHTASITNGDGDRNTRSYTYADANAHHDPYGDDDFDTDGYSNPPSHCRAYRYCCAYPNGYAHTHRNPISDADVDRYPLANSLGDANGDSD
jgi:hypothetical protein